LLEISGKVPEVFETLRGVLGKTREFWERVRGVWERIRGVWERGRVGLGKSKGSGKEEGVSGKVHVVWERL
jgi:hypothetical protein